MSGGQTAVSPFTRRPFLEMFMLAAVKAAHLLVVYFCRCVRAEVSDRVQISLTPPGSRQGEAFHTREKAAQKSQKLVLREDLILLCEPSFHVAGDRRVREHSL